MKDVYKQIEAVAHRYHYVKAPPIFTNLERWWHNLWLRIKDFLDSLKFHTAFSDASKTSDAIRAAVIFVGVVAAVGITVLLVKRLSEVKKQTEAKKAGPVTTSKIMTSDDWETESVRLAEKSDYREACRALYLALLRLLHENKIAEYAPTKTNYEYYYSLVSHPTLAVTFKSLANLIESVWFGNKQASKEDYVEFSQALKTVKEDMKHNQPPPRAEQKS